MKPIKSFGGLLPFKSTRESLDRAFSPDTSTGMGAGRKAIMVAGILATTAAIGLLLSVLFGPHQ